MIFANKDEVFNHYNTIVFREIVADSALTYRISMPENYCEELAKNGEMIIKLDNVLIYTISTKLYRTINDSEAFLSDVYRNLFSDMTVVDRFDSIMWDKIKANLDGYVIINNNKPRNNDGRVTCAWCNNPTKTVPGFMYNTTYTVCTKCGK